MFDPISDADDVAEFVLHDTCAEVSQNVWSDDIDAVDSSGSHVFSDDAVTVESCLVHFVTEFIPVCADDSHMSPREEFLLRVWADVGSIDKSAGTFEICFELCCSPRVEDDAPVFSLLLILVGLQKFCAWLVDPVGDCRAVWREIVEGEFASFIRSHSGCDAKDEIGPVRRVSRNVM